MNIYKVSRTDYHYHDDDDYEAFVCIAESEEDAKMLHPDDFRMEINERGLFIVQKTTPTSTNAKLALSLDKWARKPENVSVELIGVVNNDSYDIEQVILTSKEA